MQVYIELEKKCPTRQCEVRSAHDRSCGSAGSALVASDTSAHSVVTSALSAAGGGGTSGSWQASIGPGPAPSMGCR